MMQAVWVALGGALGALGRYGVSLVAARIFGVHFPWGTLMVNVIGGLAIGVLAARASAAHETPWLFLGVGVLGGFTTFSTFSLETMRLLEHSPHLALLYAGASVLLSVGGCWAGLTLGQT